MKDTPEGFPMVLPTLQHARYARDIFSHCRAAPDVGCTAEIRGLVTVNRRHGGIAFLKVEDATGAIQVICEKAKLTPAEWTQVKGVKTKARVRAMGTVGPSKHKELSILATAFAVTTLPILEKTHLGESLQKFGLTGRFFLARLRRRATEYFSGKGFDEYEPEFLSALPNDSSIRSLSVVFPGWGNPVYLNTAPLAQLLESVLVTGAPRVFSVGRCFSDAVRDGYTSAESMIVSALELDIDLEALIAVSTHAVRHVFDDITTLPEVAVDLSSWARVTSALADIDNVLSAATAQVFDLPEAAGPSGIVKITAFRLVVPPNTAVAEGHWRRLEGNTSIGGVTLHLERMLRLIKDRALSGRSSQA